MRIILVGGRGYIGSTLSHFLRLHGNTVFTTSRERIDGFLQLDVLNTSDTIETFLALNPDIVINLSWIANGNFWNSPGNLESLERNIRLNEIVFKSSIMKYICIGSSAEYAKSRTPVSATTSILAPDSLYGRSKVEAFRNFSELSLSSSVKGVWLRPFNVYGGKADSARLLPKIVEHAKMNQRFALSKPNAVRDWIHIDDLVSVVKLVVENDSPHVLNVGSGIGKNNREICLLAEEILGLDWFVAESFESEIDCLISLNDEWLTSKWEPKHGLERFFLECGNEKT